MENNTSVKNWHALVEDLGKQMTRNGQQHDDADSFVGDNYTLIKEHGFLTAMIPLEFGGGGISHKDMCDIIRKIAHYCPSTALAFSMHQQLLAANIWKYRHNKGGEGVLKKVADKNLVLVSTGARDWLESNGNMEKVEGGFLFDGQKHFASQSAAGDVLVTSAPYNDPVKGWQVLHFAVPMNAEGISVADNWYTLGMRGTGSHTVNLQRVFVPEESIVLERPRGEYHTFWNVVLTVALPLIMSAYVGVAEQAFTLALSTSRKKEGGSPTLPVTIGEMNNHLTAAQVALDSMVDITRNFNFMPEDKTGVAMLTRKSLVAEACKSTVEKAMEVAGGQSFFRSFGLERLFRDVQASGFHPLPEKQQQHFAGEYFLRNGH